MPATSAPEPKDLLGLLQRLVEHDEEADDKISMVPSENRMSVSARVPLMMDVYNRYFFNSDNTAHLWQFRGAQGLWDIEEKLCSTLGAMVHARHVSMRPLSGLSAMTVVFAALTERDDHVVTVAIPQGGHPASTPIARRLGCHVSHLTGSTPHTIDLDHAERLFRKVRPRLVYVDQATCLFPTSIERLAEVLRRSSPESILHVDASQWLGLIMSGAMENPLDAGADIISSSLHKTFPGPHKAILGTNDRRLFERMREAESYLVSSNHFAVTLSAGLALLEFAVSDWRAYGSAVVENSNTFGRLLAQRGFAPDQLDGCYSAGHQVWVDTQPAGADAYHLSGVLEKCGVLVNPSIDVPGLPAPSWRLGLQEATIRGWGHSELEELADILLSSTASSPDIPQLRSRVADLCRTSTFPWRTVEAEEPKRAFFAAVLSDLEATLHGRTGDER